MRVLNIAKRWLANSTMRVWHRLLILRSALNKIHVYAPPDLRVQLELVQAILDLDGLPVGEAVVRPVYSGDLVVTRHLYDGALESV